MTWRQAGDRILVKVPSTLSDGVTRVVVTATEKALRIETSDGAAPSVVPWFRAAAAVKVSTTPRHTQVTLVYDPETPAAAAGSSNASESKDEEFLLEWPRLFGDKGTSRTHTKRDWSVEYVSGAMELATMTDAEFEAAMKRMSIAMGDGHLLDADEDGCPNGHPAFLARAKAEGRVPAAPGPLSSEEAAGEAEDDAFMEALLKEYHIEHDAETGAVNMTPRHAESLGQKDSPMQ